MYTTRNFRTKKALKEAVAAWHEGQNVRANVAAAFLGTGPARCAPPVTYYQPGPFGGNEPRDGTFCCEGPHYPEPHRWYATCTAKNGVIVKVK